MSSNILCLLFNLVCFQSLLAGQQISIEEAQSNNWINYKITGINKAHITNSGNNNYGQCIRLEILNQSNQNLVLNLENGRNLNSQNVNIQDMVVTKRVAIHLAPGQKKRYRVYAMSAQKFKVAPNENNQFRVGEMVDGKLQKITTFVELKNFQNLCGQQGVWVISNNQAVSSISSGSADMRNQMVSFASNVVSNNGVSPVSKPAPISSPTPVATPTAYTPERKVYASKFGIYTEPGDLQLTYEDLKGNGYIEFYGSEQPTFSHSIRKVRNELVLSGNIEFSVFAQTNVLVALYNSAHQQKAIFVNKTHQPGAYNYGFNASGISHGKYYIKLFYHQELIGRHDVFVQ